MSIAGRLRKLRSNRRLTQAQIADVLNTTQQQYCKYEHELQEIPVRHIITLCRFYKVSADWLLGLTVDHTQ